MGNISLPNNIANGQQADATPLMANLNTIVNDYNGNIQNVNIAALAAIDYSKINLSDSILNSDINASASISSSKLATITTAGKVSGAALTSLASIPSGAGIIPAANLTFPTISTGTISHGAVIPLPGGYSEAKCKWIVSMNSSETLGEEHWDVFWQRCSANGTRTVTCQVGGGYTPGAYDNAQNAIANYMIIGTN